ncbi:S-layer homology domain-containing protein [Paenibacillus farraposensis]|uniref:S-layer homology domain-containing protein n=1 Tax=Paenibacillus farraposensis TaxID=2807095 RepID=UPI00361379D6
MPVFADRAFNDIEHSYAADAIEAMAAQGYVTGYQDGSFRPVHFISRQEWATIFAKTLKRTSNNRDVTSFRDVSPWALPYVQILQKENITKGINDQLFGAKQNMTRQDMAVWYARYFGVSEDTRSAGISGFVDQPDISDYAQTSVWMMERLELIKGDTNHYFYPKKFVTRQDATLVAYRVWIGGDDLKERAKRLLESGNGAVTTNQPSSLPDPDKAAVDSAPEINHQSVTPEIEEPKSHRSRRNPASVTPPEPKSSVTQPDHSSDFVADEVVIKAPELVNQPETYPSYQLSFELYNKGHLVSIPDVGVTYKFSDTLGVFDEHGKIAHPENIPAADGFIPVELEVTIANSYRALKAQTRLAVKGKAPPVDDPSVIVADEAVIKAPELINQPETYPSYQLSFELYKEGHLVSIPDVGVTYKFSDTLGVFDEHGKIAHPENIPAADGFIPVELEVAIAKPHRVLKAQTRLIVKGKADDPSVIVADEAVIKAPELINQPETYPSYQLSFELYKEGHLVSIPDVGVTYKFSDTLGVFDEHGKIAHPENIPAADGFIPVELEVAIAKPHRVLKAQTRLIVKGKADDPSVIVADEAVIKAPELINQPETYPSYQLSFELYKEGHLVSIPDASVTSVTYKFSDTLGVFDDNGKIAHPENIPAADGFIPVELEVTIANPHRVLKAQTQLIVKGKAPPVDDPSVIVADEAVIKAPELINQPETYPSYQLSFELYNEGHLVSIPDASVTSVTYKFSDTLGVFDEHGKIAHPENIPAADGFIPVELEVTIANPHRVLKAQTQLVVKGMTPPPEAPNVIRSVYLATSTISQAATLDPAAWSMPYVFHNAKGEVIPPGLLPSDLKLRIEDSSGIFDEDGHIANLHLIPAVKSVIPFKIEVESPSQGIHFISDAELTVVPGERKKQYFAVSIILQGSSEEGKTTTVDEIKQARQLLMNHFGPNLKVTWAMQNEFVFYAENRPQLKQVLAYVDQYGDEVGIMDSEPNNQFNLHSWEDREAEWLYMYRYNALNELHQGGTLGSPSVFESMDTDQYRKYLPKSLSSYTVNPEQAQWLKDHYRITSAMGWSATQYNVNNIYGEGSPLMPYWSNKDNPIVPAQGLADNSGTVFMNSVTIDPIGSRYTEGSSRWTLAPGDPNMNEKTDAAPQLYIAQQYLDNPYQRLNTVNYMSIILDIHSFATKPHLSQIWDNFVKHFPADREVEIVGVDGLKQIYESSAGSNNDRSEFSLMFRGSGIASGSNNSPANLRYLWTENASQRIILSKEDGDAAWSIIDFTDYTRSPVPKMPYGEKNSKVDVSYVTGRNFKLAPAAPLTADEIQRVKNRLKEIYFSEKVNYQ